MGVQRYDGKTMLPGELVAELELRRIAGGGFEASILLEDGDRILGGEADTPANALWELSQRLEKVGQELVTELLTNTTTAGWDLKRSRRFDTADTDTTTKGEG